MVDFNNPHHSQRRYKSLTNLFSKPIFYKISWLCDFCELLGCSTFYVFFPLEGGGIGFLCILIYLLGVVVVFFINNAPEDFYSLLSMGEVKNSEPQGCFLWWRNSLTLISEILAMIPMTDFKNFNKSHSNFDKSHKIRRTRRNPQKPELLIRKVSKWGHQADLIVRRKTFAPSILWLNFIRLSRKWSFEI